MIDRVGDRSAKPCPSCGAHEWKIIKIHERKLWRGDGRQYTHRLRTLECGNCKRWYAEQEPEEGETI